MEANDVRMFHLLQHLQLIVYHLLVALDIFLEDDFYGVFLSCMICLPYDTICPST